MHLKLPVVLLSVCALAAPGAIVHGKDKDKDKNKDKKEQKSDDRRDDRHDNDDRDGKITICHIPPGNRSARHAISVSESAWQAHQDHGDHRGACGHGVTDHDRRFNQLDTNNDERLTFSEFRGERATFDRLDRNDDGLLSRVEYYRR